MAGAIGVAIRGAAGVAGAATLANAAGSCWTKWESRGVAAGAPQPRPTSLADFMESRGACAPWVGWMRRQPSAAAAWASCPRPEWQLVGAAHLGVPREQLVLTAAACVRAAIDKAAGDNGRALNALSVADRWARGDAGVGDVRAAAAHAWAGAGLLGPAAAFAAIAADAARTPQELSVAAAYVLKRQLTFPPAAFAGFQFDAEDAPPSALTESALGEALAAAAMLSGLAIAGHDEERDASPRAVHAALRQVAEIVRQHIPWNVIAAHLREHVDLEHA